MFLLLDKVKFNKLLFLAVLFLTFSACSNRAGKIKATAAAAQKAATPSATTVTTYQLDSGTLNWIGSKALGSAHQGTINIAMGKLGLTVDGKIATGAFTIDMTSITCTDLKVEEGKEKLE